MPKSKRARIVHTSAVQKKSRKTVSASLFSAVQSAASSYAHVFVFSVDNMRNTYLKDVRQHFSDSRVFFGKTKVMAKALGSGESDEPAAGISGLSRWLRGSVGLLCTDQPVSEVLDFFESFVQVDFARAGIRAIRTFVVPEGIVYSTGGEQPVEDDVPLPHSLEVTVRKWGMPTRLEKGRVILDQGFVLCEEGKVLNSNQTALLKLFGVTMAEFRVQALAYWSAASGDVSVVDQEAADRQANGVALPDVDEEMDEG